MINSRTGQIDEFLTNFSPVKPHNSSADFISQIIKKSKSQVIAIYGPSSGGKTTFSEKLLNVLGKDNALLISVDDYWKYDRQEMKKRNITGYDWESRSKEKFLNDLQLLKNLQPIQKPVFDYVAEKPANKYETIEPQNIIIIEGTLDFRGLADIIIFTYADDETLINRRLQRDKNKTAFKSLKELQDYLINKSIPAYKNNLLPLIPETDFIVDTDRNLIYQNEKFFNQSQQT